MQKEIKGISKTFGEGQKTIQKEIKGISGIFGENQKVLISQRDDRYASISTRYHSKTIKAV